MNKSWEEICMDAIPVIRTAGKYVQENRRLFSFEEITQKGDRDFVTEIDMGSERLLVEGLQKVFPEAGFLTEEKTIQQSEASLFWVVDPIDGTTNFIHNTPVTAVSVALMQGSNILVGIVYEVTQDEMFYTWKESTASYCNGKEIVVSSCSDFRKALVATGFPYDRTDRLDGILSSAKYFLENCQDLRRFGSAATDLCYVACGRFEVYYEAYLQLWDIAAGILIARNAGAIVSDFDANQVMDGNSVIACHSNLLKKVHAGIFFGKQSDLKLGNQ